MSGHGAIAIARRGVDTYSAGDWGGYADILGPSSIYEEPATQRRVVGTEQIIAVGKAWKSAFPDSRGTVTNAFASNDDVMLEITWQGTQTGPLEGPTGPIPPTGKSVTVKAVQVVRVEGGKAREIRHYFDLMGLMAQLGVLAAPGAERSGG